MPTKQQLYDIIDSSGKISFTKGEAKDFVCAVSGTAANIPTYFKKGDIVVAGVGLKKRPCVVIKVCLDVLYLIPLSTTEDSLNLMPFRSRFLGEGFFSKGVSVVTIEYAKENFTGVFDNPKALNAAIKKIKEEINSIQT